MQNAASLSGINPYWDRLLIETFSHPGDTVLDFTMGRGSTGVACVKTGRHFVGIEAHEAYFAVAEKRIRQAQSIRTKDEKARTAA